MGLQIKNDDTVFVMTGKEKGKNGRVLSVSTDKGSILLEKINIVKKHMKPTRKLPSFWTTRHFTSFPR